MTIEIQDTYFNMECYECTVSVNGEKVESSVENDGKKITIQAVTPEDNVELELKNFVLAGKHGVWVILLYWIASIFGGGEPNPFGRPFDAVLKLSAIKGNHISIRTRKIWAEKPFELVAGNAEFTDNRFVVKNEHIRKWLCGFVLPIDILLLLIGVMILLIPNPIRFIGLIAVVSAVAFSVYAGRVVARLSKYSKTLRRR